MGDISDSTSKAIVCENLVKIYKTADSEVLALQGLDLVVEHGEIMAIIGNSGSGKSTLLNMIGGLDRPSAGKLWVDGLDLFKLDEKQLVNYKRKTVGFVWQNNARNLLPFLSVWQNVQLPMLLGRESAKKSAALDLLALVGMDHKKNSRLFQLSGGEQQRVAIAIALANRPSVLLADEPTGSVDAKTGENVLNVFRQVNKELHTTVVIVTHDRQLAKKVNRVVSIRDGKIASERLMKESYRERLSEITSQIEEEKVQDEFVVIDRAGRIQLPRDALERIGATDSKMVMEVEENRIVLKGTAKND